MPQFYLSMWYLNLIVYAWASYQASLIEPSFVFWRESKYPWRDQTGLICHRRFEIRPGDHFVTAISGQ